MAAQNKRLARALNKGKNPIAGFGAASRKALATRNGPKSSETDHLQGKQFSGLGGRHHAPASQGAHKNAYGSMSDASTGRHSLNNGQVGRRGSYSRERDVAGAYKDSVGTARVGKHRKPGA